MSIEEVNTEYEIYCNKRQFSFHVPWSAFLIIVIILCNYISAPGFLMGLSIGSCVSSCVLSVFYIVKNERLKKKLLALKLVR